MFQISHPKSFCQSKQPVVPGVKWEIRNKLLVSAVLKRYSDTLLMLLYLRESLSLMSQRQSIRRGIQESCPWSSWVRDLNPRFVNLVPGRLSNETSVIFIMRSSFVQLWNIKYPELIAWRKQWLKNYRQYKLFSNVWKDESTNYFIMVGKKISAKYYFLK